MADIYIATLVAPKARQLVEVYAVDKTGNEYSLFEPGCPEECEVLGGSYTENQGSSGYDTVRVHTPTGVRERSKGLGLVLYCGTALGVEALRDLSGVHSQEGTRSPAAERFWRSVVESKLAFTADGEGEEEEIEVEHCEAISDRDLDDGVQITSDEVCGDVTAVKSETTTYDVLLAERVRKSGLVLHYTESDAVVEPPSDLLANLDLSNLKIGDRVDAKFLWRVAEIMAKGNVDNAKRFLRRLEVQEAIAADPVVLPIYLEFFGQQRVPGVQGLRRRGLHGAILDPLPLPPESAATRRLLDRFVDVPDPDTE